MSIFDHLNSVIGSLYAASADSQKWSGVLSDLADICGGSAATLEFIDLTSNKPVFFKSSGVSPDAQANYVDHFHMISPRIQHGMRVGSPVIAYDYHFTSETEMDKNEFYADFLALDNFRYFVSGTLQRTDRYFSVFAVQRTVDQGHVDTKDTELVQLLRPHVRRSLDLGLRLKKVREYSNVLEEALNNHAEGVVLIANDGSVAFVNKIAERIFCDQDGIRVTADRLHISDSGAQKRLDSAIECLRKDGIGIEAREMDFTAKRKSQTLPYMLEIRAAQSIATDRKAPYLAIIFIRDLASIREISLKRLAVTAQLTPTESRMAKWISAGRSVPAFATRHDISPNTAYTHYRHVKEKMGCNSLPELVIKLRRIGRI